MSVGTKAKSGGKKTDALTERDCAVLRTVIERFVDTAEPVASQALAHDTAVSPATIRNTMARLEALGYLEQPHTSSGRSPTPKGLRFYLDALMPAHELSSREQTHIETKLWPRLGGASVYSNASKGLSEIAAQVAVVVSPRLPGTIFDHIQILPVGDKRLVIVCVARSGSVHHKLVDVEHSVEPARLERMNQLLREGFSGLSLLDIRARLAAELQAERARYDALYRETLELASRGAPEVDAAEVCIEGTAQVVLQPEFAGDTAQLHKLLRAVEEKRLLLSVLERLPAEATGIHITLGGELGLEELGGLALIAAPYNAVGGESGILAVLGPLRMNYARIVPLVGYCASTMTRHFAGR